MLLGVSLHILKQLFSDGKEGTVEEYFVLGRDEWVDDEREERM